MSLLIRLQTCVVQVVCWVEGLLLASLLNTHVPGCEPAGPDAECLLLRSCRPLPIDSSTRARTDATSCVYRRRNVVHSSIHCPFNQSFKSFVRSNQSLGRPLVQPLVQSSVQA